jgi:hypothetical protein
MLQHVNVPPLLLSQIPDQDTLRILVVADLHIPLGEVQKTLLLRDREWLSSHDWVILLGDMTACYGTPGEYRSVDAFIHTLDRAYSVVNGNHEFSFVPCEDGSVDYGKRWEPSPPEVQRSQLERFEAFYQIDSRFQACRHALAGLCLLGIDGIGQLTNGLLNPEHETWFERVLDSMKDSPMLIFCHFPLATQAMNAIRYYEPGRVPCYIPNAAIRNSLAHRQQPTFWFSGHVHFRPSHPLSAPYKTEVGVWQIHCPDSWGFGRQDNERWRPEHYDGLFAKTLELDCQHLHIITTDLARGCIVSRNRFDLTKGQGPERSASVCPQARNRSST